MNRYKKNLHIVGNKVISYTTHVATIDSKNRNLIRLGWWSQTTSKHINYVASQYDLTIVDKEEEEETKTAGDGFIGMMKAFMILGDLTGNESIEDKVKYKERIVFATMRANIPNWETPNNWTELTPEIKLERLEELQKMA
jgi:hypothetical protein